MSVLGCLVLLGCGSEVIEPTGPPPSPVPPSPSVTITHGKWQDTEQPPPFRVRYADTELELYAFTFCYSMGCVDGADPDPPRVGSPEELLVFVPVRDFDNLSVHQVEAGEDCGGRRVAAHVTPLGNGWWLVRPRGPAGDYAVDLFASGEGSGDMVATVRWQTPSDQPLPEPEAWLALIADHDGRPDSYGLELSVINLAASPAEYAATITVTAGNGQSLTFEATRSPERCTGEGEVVFDGPASEGTRAAALGDFPFTLEVELILDGVAHTANAIFPDDVIEGNEPAVALRFSPPLQ